MMGRRDFITLLGSAAAAWPLAARAQQAIPIIGSIYSVSAASWTDNMDAFRRGLAEVGFVDGRNVAIDYRWADGRIERMREFAADLIRRKVAVIVTGGATAGVRDVVTATKTVPIVFTTALDPVASGLVASLNRPGANVTGVTFIGSELVGKQLELLKELIPGAAKIATLVNPNNPVMAEGVIQNARTAARRLGLDVIVIHASTESEIDAAFTSAVEQRASALFAEDAYFASRGEQIAALGLRHRLPTFGVPQNVTAGMLMGYGANIPDSYRQAGI
jgi:putative tryptophan/tyrosine transport system substrate-binding protein